jgi:SPX domain protein involved in polyphosphate accumulation
MKFGENLKQKIKPDWKFYYIDYDGLKRLIKERTSAKDFFEESDEANFVNYLEMEMQKVLDFRDVKIGELTRHVQYCEEKLNNDAARDEKSKQELESEISRVTDELVDLSGYTRLNYTGFIKILKKHDKHTAFMLKPMFMIRLKSKPFFLETLDNLVYRLSKIFDKLRRGADNSVDLKDN